MRRITGALLLTGILLIASIMIAVSVIGCKNDSPAPTPTPQPSVAATPTSQPTVTATATQTPASNKTNTPTATPKSTQTSGPTATPTATPKATSTPTRTPTPTTTPMPTATPTQAQTAVSINASNTVKQGGSFSIDININNVSCMALAQLDLRFNNSCIAYVSCNATSQIGGESGTVEANIIQSGLLRVVVDYSDYAAAHSGNGITGSGYLCKLTFNATTNGSSPLAFVSEQGDPEGELLLWQWSGNTPSAIVNVKWTNSSITIVKN